MAKGILLECKEDMELVDLDMIFIKGKNYLGVPTNDNITIIDRNHKSFELNEQLFERHFKFK